MAALIGITAKPAAGTSGYTCKVPLDIISEDGVPPEKGDSVSFQVDGTVQSSDAEDATVKISAVNGQPVDESASEEAAEDDSGAPESTADMGARLKAGAAGGGGPPMF